MRGSRELLQLFSGASIVKTLQSSLRVKDMRGALKQWRR